LHVLISNSSSIRERERERAGHEETTVSFSHNQNVPPHRLLKTKQAIEKKRKKKKRQIT
jgi:hypothetical protein